MSGVLQHHFPPGRRGGRTTGRAALGGIVYLDPRGGVGRVDINPARAVGPGLQLPRQLSEKCGRLGALGHKKGIHALQRGMNIPGTNGADFINQDVNPFPG